MARLGGRGVAVTGTGALGPPDLRPVELRRVELCWVEVPLRPTVRSATLDQRARESILVTVTAVDGSEGVAECPTPGAPGYATETTAEAWEALVGALGPAALAGGGPGADASPPAPAARAALDDAVLDARLRATGVPAARWLADHLGHRARAAVRWTAVLPDVSVEPAAAARWARDAVADGASWLKLKADGPQRLAAVLAAVRAATDVPVAADFNGSLPASRAHEVDGLGLALLEQPLAPGTPWSELAELRAALATPVALDESLASARDLEEALAAGAMDVASVKPARIGGVLAAARAVSRCAGAGVPCFVGGMFELGIGRASALAVASLDACDLPTDLGPSRRYVADDVCEPLGTDGSGAMVVPSGAGFGRVPGPLPEPARVVARVVLTAGA